MKFNNKVKNNGWVTKFAFFPVKIGDNLIWLERYASRFMGLYDEVQLYSGCAERVAYPCDCYRHGENE